MFHYVVETPGQYGDLYYWQLGGLRTYMAFHPDHIRELLVTQAPIFRRSRVTSQLLVPLVGNGLVVSEGEYWRKQRRLIQPAFTANASLAIPNRWLRIRSQCWRAGRMVRHSIWQRR
ncbi:MAG: cytochrome P450 [Caldilineaceae bacterium]